MNEKTHKKILNIMLIYVVLQPLFDILSNLYIDKHISISISTYVKPVFVFSMCFYVFLRYGVNRKRWIFYGILFLTLIFGHSILLYNLAYSKELIVSEIRLLINILYMVGLYIIFKTLYIYSNDKKDMLRKIKKTVLCTFIVYAVLFLIAVLTNTSGKTYEYADELKRGFKGWFDSGQILGHSISILFPIMLYTAMKPRNKWYYRVLLILPIVIVTMLIGTKVPYIIVLLVLAIYILISIFCKIFIKHYKINIFNLIFSFAIIVTMIIVFKYTPLKYNIELNEESLRRDLSIYNISEYDGSINITFIEENIKNGKGKLSSLITYKEMCEKGSEDLRNLYLEHKVHPSDNRNRQLYYSKTKYNAAPIVYKIFGIGYFNQDNLLAIERDFFMAFFCFGILGFICLLCIPIIEFIKSTIYLIKNIKYNDLEMYLIYAGLGIFFCISAVAGYTYIHTTFSINLVLLITLLNLKISINESHKKSDKPKKISFLLLHLGYGGIETATINTANALSKKYDIELISFYKMNKEQTAEINKKIKVRYLYNGQPNRNEFKEAVKNKNVFKILTEGIKSTIILINKKVLVIREIKRYKGDCLISTRVEFSTLLSKYGKETYNKIAAEHHHHNNNKKYINKLKKMYYNIDYLFALTSSLKNDYEKFLEDYNSHTKVILVPNMLMKESTKVSDLKSKNIISIGRLHEGKRIDELIKIFSKIKNKSSKLYIIGDGDEYINLSRLIDELKLSNRVFLLGYKNHVEMEKYLLDSCIFAMTSISEGLPMVLLEAGCVGLPSIAYETDSGVTDIIDDGVNGFVIKNRNEEEYVAKLDEYLKDKSMQQSMSKNMLAKTKEFSANKIVKIWTDVLEYKYEENSI